MRVTPNSGMARNSGPSIAGSAKQLAEFIKMSPEDHRKVAELICSIGDRMGKDGIVMLRDFVQAAQEGNLEEFSKKHLQKGVPLSIISDLLAVGQELEATAREKLDHLFFKAQRGLVELSKQALKQALILLV